jgi:hypothetical protein
MQKGPPLTGDRQVCGVLVSGHLPAMRQNPVGEQPVCIPMPQKGGAGYIAGCCSMTKSLHAAGKVVQ